MCICPEGYVGDCCEHRQRQTQIDTSFHHKLTIPPFLLIHFFAVQYRFCTNISTQIISSHRCQSIGQLLNETFAKQHLLKRIKYYHIPCFEFDHSLTYDCGGYNCCENDGYCFQNDPKCPTPPICACGQCYFESRCQLTTKVSALSLNTILGYHIHAGTIVSQQPIIMKFSIGLTTLMLIFGFINSFLSFQTF
jgi:hypothetical protein